METSDGETQVSSITASASTSDRQLQVPKSTSTSGQQQQVSKTTTMKPETKYTPQDKGPFVVLFKAETEISEHYIAQNMKSQGIDFRKIQRISRSGKNVIKVTTDDWNSANKVLGVKADRTTSFIPNEYIYREIIVFNVPIYLTNFDIKESIEIPNAPAIQDIERQTKWNPTQQIAEPVDRVKISFRGNTIPKEVYVCRVVHKCAIYVRKPLFCKECKSFGHTKKWCKDTTTCRDCYQKHPQTIECPTTKRSCRYCLEDHATGHRDCVETKTQWEVSKIMAQERTDRNTARRKVQEGEYPGLPKHTTTPQQRIQDWQNPNSLNNIIAKSEIQDKIINQLKLESSNLHKYIQGLMDTLKKNDPKGLWKGLNEEYTNLTRKPNSDTSQGTTN